eukprot:g77390.t1
MIRDENIFLTIDRKREHVAWFLAFLALYVALIQPSPPTSKPVARFEVQATTKDGLEYPRRSYPYRSECWCKCTAAEVMNKKKFTQEEFLFIMHDAGCWNDDPAYIRIMNWISTEGWKSLPDLTTWNLRDYFTMVLKQISAQSFCDCKAETSLPESVWKYYLQGKGYFNPLS